MADAKPYMDLASIDALRLTLRAEQAVAAAEEFDGLWREHVETVKAFLTVAGQWRVVPHGGGGMIGPGGGVMLPIMPLFVGLDYASVRAGLDAEDIVVTPELWRGLRTIEAEARKTLNEDA